MNGSGSKPGVVVGMSGGVDSSVAAALLVEGGYAVTGIMLRLWTDESQTCENSCCTPEAVGQARAVAAQLGIPFYVLNAQDVFKKAVVDYFIRDLSAGLTPNPCLVCNRLVRWGFLLDQVSNFNAEFLATGHYARLTKNGDGRVRLLKGLDAKKDQSYVLSGLNQEQLSRSLFPLGGMPKEDVRKKAAELGFEVADKKDSQDLCFIGEDGVEGFLSRHQNSLLEPGEIVDTSGKVLGVHQGLARYTIGQRKGLRIAFPEPYYVIDKDAVQNRVIAGFLNELGKKDLSARDVNWISGQAPAGEFQCMVKIRYKAEPAEGFVFPLGYDKFKIRFERALRDITPGQRVVLFQGEECLGGGTII
ncbi:MAG: tRNA 2-thiouridine(34) synthase MnmA [Anaerolineaceae bacterium]